MKPRKTNRLLIGMLCLGVALLLYPSISNYWNSFHATQAIASYAQQVAAIDDAEYEQMLQAAVDYNKKLQNNANRWNLTEAQRAEYESLLDVSGTGIMGYIEIPKIHVSLPIYHTVEESVLQVAVGHIEGSSLPVGGAGTHCLLSGHRGLPSARLFTDLDKMAEGDTFLVRVMDEVLTYEVDQIRIVLPDELQDLDIVPGEDYCTLITCTPYGINSHRMLVRGHRIATDDHGARLTADAQTMEPLLVAPLVAAPILLVLVLGVLLWPAKGGKKR